MSSVGFIGGKFLPLHQGHVYAITQASNQCDKLYVVLSHDENGDRGLCKETDFPYINERIRLRWLKQLTKDMPHVEVIDIIQETTDNSFEVWLNGAEQIKSKITEGHIDFIFSSEHEYTPIFEKLYPNAKHIVIDNSRKKIPISATMLRQNKDSIYKYWDYVPQVVRPFFVKKVVVVGVESCGKSTLVRNLAKIYNTNYVEEFGRTVCEKYGGYKGIFTEDTYREIVYGHKVEELKAIESANKITFIDTEALVTAYYLMTDLELDAEKECDFYEEIVKLQEYDLWLFLEPDVKWVDDGTRLLENQEEREFYNNVLKDLLNDFGIEYHIINGNYQERLVESMKLIENLF